MINFKMKNISSMSAYECQYTKELFTTVSSKYGSHVQNMNAIFVTVFYHLKKRSNKSKISNWNAIKCFKDL